MESVERTEYLRLILALETLEARKIGRLIVKSWTDWPNEAGVADGLKRTERRKQNNIVKKK